MAQTRRESQDVGQNARINLGWLEPGNYRVSFRFDPQSLAPPVILRMENQAGELLFHRELQPIHLSMMEEGDCPDLYFTLQQRSNVSAAIEGRFVKATQLSLVWGPDIQCVSRPAVMQAEQLITTRAEIVPDEQAERKTALLCQANSENTFSLYGPYFRFPDGFYEAQYSTRTPGDRPQNGSMDAVLIVSPGDVAATRKIDLASLPAAYTPISVTASLTDKQDLITAALLYPHSDVIVDTIKIIQRKRPAPANPFFLIPDPQKNERISMDGRVINPQEIEESRIALRDAPIAGADWNAAAGNLYVDKNGRIFDGEGRAIAQFPMSAQESVLCFRLSSDGKTRAAVTSGNRILLLRDDAFDVIWLDPYPYPIRDLVVEEGNAVFVLYGNGKVWTNRPADELKEFPDFYQDAVRSLIRIPGGFYLVDFSGAIHSTSGVKPIHSPYYEPIDWIAHARRTPQGQWFYLRTNGELLTFQE
jgi:hypothetical protein